jgi:hypothetical protein
VAELTGELWIITHADLKATARVRAFFELVGEGSIHERDPFEGKRRQAGRPLPSRLPATQGGSA